MIISSKIRKFLLKDFNKRVYSLLILHHVKIFQSSTCNSTMFCLYFIKVQIIFRLKDFKMKWWSNNILIYLLSCTTSWM